MEFITQNILLVALVVVSGAALVASLLRRSGASVSAVDATLLINRDDAVVLDVREPVEFASGHLPNARNIPQSKLADRLGELEPFKERTLLVVCASGIRSAKACDLLRKSGFAKVVNLDGGVSTWQQANLPLAKQSKQKG